MALFSIRINSIWRPPPSWIISNDHISATGDPFHFMFGSRVGFSGTADRTALFTIISNGHISSTAHDLRI